MNGKIAIIAVLLAASSLCVLISDESDAESGYEVGDTLVVNIPTEGCNDVKSGAFVYTFDADKLTFVEGKWNVSAFLADMRPSEGVFAFANPTDLSSSDSLITLTFTCKVPGKASIDGTITYRTSSSDDVTEKMDTIFIEIVCSHPHLLHHPYAAPTPEADGNTEYWSCPDCGRFFSDPNGIDEIAGGSWITLWSSGYTITYELNGGINSPENPAGYNAGSEVVFSDPVKEGNLFMGWFTDSGFTQQITRIDKGTTGDIMLYAKWEVRVYTITFDTDGGTPVGPITQDFGTVITVPENPVKDHCTFIRWDPLIPETMPAEDMTIRAVWAEDRCTVIFDDNDLTVTSSGTSIVSGSSVGFGEVLTLNAMPHTGYEATGITANGIPISGNTYVVEDSYVSFVVSYRMSSYTIEWQNYDGSIFSSSVVQHGSTITAPSTDPEREPDAERIYRFEGWDGFTPGMVADGDRTFTAVYVSTPREYNVTYTLNGNIPEGIVAPAQESVAVGTIIIIPAVDVEGYHTTYKVDGEASDRTFIMPAKDVFVEIMYAEGAIHITGISLDKTELSMDVGMISKLVATVTPSDSTDDICWSSSDEGVVSVQSGSVTAIGAGSAIITVGNIDGSVTATCQVTVYQSYSVVVIAGDGGRAYASPSVDVRPGTTVTLSYIADIGYRFGYWEGQGLVITDDEFIMPSADVTVRAVFEESGTVDKESDNGSISIPLDVAEDLGIQDAEKLVFISEPVKNPIQTNIPADAKVYDMGLTYDGKGIAEFSEPVEVFISYVPSFGEDVSKLKVYYVSDDGKTVEDMKAVYDTERGGMVFDTIHLSTYAVTDETIEPVQDGSGGNNNTMPIVAAAMAVIAIVAAAIFLLHRGGRI